MVTPPSGGTELGLHGSFSVRQAFCYSGFMKRSEILFGLLRIPMDFAMVLLGFTIGYQLRLKGDFIPKLRLDRLDFNHLPAPDEFLTLVLIFASLLIVVFTFFGLYQFKNTQGFLHELRKVTTYFGVWLLLIMAYFFITREVFFSRLVLGFGAGFTLLFILLARGLLQGIKMLLLKAKIGRRRILLIGTNNISQKLADRIKKDPSYTLIGYLSEGKRQLKGLKKLGTLSDLASVVHAHNVEEVLQASQELTGIQDHEILEFCQEHHLDYHFVPDILDVERSNVEIYPIGDIPLIHLKPTSLDGWGKVLKRSFDLFGSFFGLILLSPLFVLVALAIKLDSPGPVLFTRLDDGSPACRIGQYGKAFKFYKFRTMKNKTHNQRYTNLAKQNIRGEGPLVKIKDDPRITRLGGLLRRLDIDELPQLWNVFKGEMSLVGPRPHLPEEVAKYEKHHKFLLTIKPGMTGLSQIKGRSDLDFESEVRLDTFYIKHWSLLLDLKILLGTLAVIFRGHSAE